MVQVLQSAHTNSLRVEQEIKHITEDDNISTEDYDSSTEDDDSSTEDDDSSTEDDNILTEETANVVKEVFTKLADEEIKKNGLENPMKAEMIQNNNSEKETFVSEILSISSMINNSKFGVKLGELAEKMDKSGISKTNLAETSLELIKGNIIENKDREDGKENKDRKDVEENEDRENYKENTDKENGEENKKPENGGRNEKPENGGEPNSNNQETRGWISRWIAVIIFWVQSAVNALKRAVKSFVNFVKRLFNFVLSLTSRVRCSV